VFRVSDLLEVICPFIREQDFIISKNYVIKKEVSNSFGKWPSVFGNAFYIDSNYLLKDLILMIKQNLDNIYEEFDQAQEYRQAT